MKNLLLILFVAAVAVGCQRENKTLSISPEKVDKIEIYKGFSGEQINMTVNLKKEILKDLNSANMVSPHKFQKTHRILIYFNTGVIDTIRTNGLLHFYKGYYRSDENLIDKYIE